MCGSKCLSISSILANPHPDGQRSRCHPSLSNTPLPSGSLNSLGIVNKFEQAKIALRPIQHCAMLYAMTPLIF